MSYHLGKPKSVSAFPCQETMSTCCKIYELLTIIIYTAQNVQLKPLDVIVII